MLTQASWVLELLSLCASLSTRRLNSSYSTDPTSTTPCKLKPPCFCRRFCRTVREKPAAHSEVQALYGLDPMHLAQLALKDAQRAFAAVPGSAPALLQQVPLAVRLFAGHTASAQGPTSAIQSLSYDSWPALVGGSALGFSQGASELPGQHPFCLQQWM